MKKFILPLLLVAIVLASIVTSCNRSTKEVEAVNADPCAEAVQTARLEAELACCQNSNADLQARLDECMSGYEMKKVTTSTSKKATVVAKKPTRVTKSATIVATPATTIT